ncbi:hypothetical protein U14_05998 [Candidatus Moduliflexus flocculans]|uniref:Uncharacterized protein n=1 Tax=Candidatus Moduliflexus flocculans TaxID=1499966 RepID=A0A081BTH9_9BACT|nr:hypothetical protein U14_05998 [Candidatus Moduliflexus flocculans]
MKHHGTVFDDCATQETIHAHLQHYLRELFFLIDPAAPPPNGLQTLDFTILSELSHADLKQCERPICLLSEISRLLLKSGDRASLTRALAISHVIYAFKCARNESWYISSLYKGMAQIGLHNVDLGIKNVSLGLSGHEKFGMVAIDRALAYWALTSAAIANRNLGMAVAFGQQWRNAAQGGHFEKECWRANAALLLLHLLHGDARACAPYFRELERNPLVEWEDMRQFFTDWFGALAYNRELPSWEGTGVGCGNEESSRVSDPPLAPPWRGIAETLHNVHELVEPFPLFLGVRWHGDTPDEFARLCKTRKQFCRAELPTPANRRTPAIRRSHGGMGTAASALRIRKGTENTRRMPLCRSPFESFDWDACPA